MSQPVEPSDSHATSASELRAASGSRLARHRRLVLLTFSLVVTVCLLALIEGGFRIAGFGGYPPTFVEAGPLEQGATLVVTDHGGPTSYFFANRSYPGSLEPSALVMPKPPGTVRIFLVGASAAKGNPYPRPLTAGAFLEAMLEDAWAGRRVEVINLGVTAIASFPVLGIATEALDYDPDLVVAYLGNNEFYGAWGVASLHSAGRAPWMIRLIRAVRSLGIAQFIDSQRPGFDEADSRTLMEAMVGQSHIGPGDPARAAAARNLETFVGDLIDRCLARGLPIVVCLPPANERDLAPLGESSLDHLAESERERVTGLMERAKASIEVEPSAALALLRDALAAAPEHATGQYLLGQALAASGRSDEAAAAFRTAVDLDPMPWRPPSSSVEAIRRAVLAHGGVLNDMPQAFRQASPGGAIGWELMDDHVHPSLQGQALVAKSIVWSLVGIGGEMDVPRDAFDRLEPWAAYAERLGSNPYDAFAASHAMRVLAGIAFFQRSNPTFFARHDGICQRIETEAAPAARQGILRWLDPATHRGGQRPITGLVASALQESGSFEEAARLFLFAADAVPPYGSWNLEYVCKALICRVRGGHALNDDERRRAAEAIARGAFLARQGRSQSGGAEMWTGFLHQLRGELRESIPYLAAARLKLSGRERVAVDEALVQAYLASRELDNAKSVVDEGLRGPFREAYRTMLPGERHR